MPFTHVARLLLVYSVVYLFFVVVEVLHSGRQIILPFVQLLLVYQHVPLLLLVLRLSARTRVLVLPECAGVCGIVFGWFYFFA